VAAKKSKISKHAKPHGNADLSTKADGGRNNPKELKNKKTGGKRTSSSKPILPGSWKINALIFLLLVIGTVVLYAGDLHLGFFSVDDPGYVTNNRWIRNITGENISYILSHSYFANYSPVHLFSYMFDYALAGPNAYAFHLSSNLWAGIVAGFVFLVSLALTQNKAVSIAAAILFIVHPVHVEAVAWISSRKDLVATAFALPSFLAYLQYRRGGNGSKKWYIISLLLFLFAVAGKLSVATFPAIFLAYDYFVGKRPLARSIADKIPFIAVALIVALVAVSAQPSMGHRPDPYVLSDALVQNFWLLTGFGTYVLYRVPPATPQLALQIGGTFFLIAIFLAPLFLRRKLPVVAVLIYWILFAFIPSQVLSFTHPVTDRYVFFPSVAAVILLAWGIFMLTKKIPRYNIVVMSAIILTIVIFWTKNTINYLAEWKDPRSVWYAAIKKSKDPVVSQNLGSFYVDLSRNIGNATQSKTLSKEEMQRLASVVWSNDPRLPKLNAEWSTGQQGGPVEKEFKEQLASLAWDAFEKTVKTKQDRVMPGLYYNRGLILLDRGNLDGARKEFLTGVDESARESFAEVRNEVSVYCYTNLGIIAWKQVDYREALKWFRLAKDQQDLAGANWIPTLAKTCKQLEDIIASQSPVH
jgi:hypothetical protein